MPTPRLILPPSLAAAPFTVEQGRAAGLTPAELRSPALRTPFSGVRVPAAFPERLRVQGVRATVGPLPATARAPRPGRLRVMPAADVWAGLASHRRMGLDDLIILGDAVARRRDGLASLRGVTSASAGRRGVKAMRHALAMVRERVDSPQETRTRLLLVRAGIPEPECGLDVYGDGGLTWLARPDLCWPEVRLALEYDGSTHFTDEKQRRDDSVRREVYDEHDWALIVVFMEDLQHRRRLLATRVEQRLRERGLTW